MASPIQGSQGHIPRLPAHKADAPAKPQATAQVAQTTTTATTTTVAMPERAVQGTGARTQTGIKEKQPIAESARTRFEGAAAKASLASDGTYWAGAPLSDRVEYQPDKPPKQDAAAGAAEQAMHEGRESTSETDGGAPPEAASTDPATTTPADLNREQPRQGLRDAAPNERAATDTSSATVSAPAPLRRGYGLYALFHRTQTS